MIYNKSGHPVEVKKISVRIWSVRDEIEAAIGRRIKECEAAGVPLFIDDIKRFYNLNMQEPLNQQSNVIPLRPENAQPEEAQAASPAAEAAPESTPEEAKPAETEAAAPTEGAPESQTFNQAEEILAEQNKQGLDTQKPNPILERPYTRQAPDLEKITYGFALLSDINMETILSFTKDKFLHGQSVVVEFLIPQSFIMTAHVSYCSHYAIRSRIISSTRPDYRIQCRFDFSMPGERDTLRNFLKSIEPTIPQPVKKVKKETEEDSLGL
jgi:hypothetical protein